MATRTIIEGDNPRLRKTSKVVNKINNHITELLDDLAQTMYEARGVGLAAPQVGVLRRVIVVDAGDGLIELINPEIVSMEGQQREEEGCLSLPEDNGYVIRPAKVTVKGLNRAGEEVTYTGEELLARAFVHEIDHLDGVLFTDKMIERIVNEDHHDGGL